jgi:hypothetical protein
LEEIMAEVKIRSGNDEKVIDREPPPEVGKTISLGGRQWLVLSVSFLIRKAALQLEPERVHLPVSIKPRDDIPDHPGELDHLIGSGIRHQVRAVIPDGDPAVPHRDHAGTDLPADRPRHRAEMTIALYPPPDVLREYFYPHERLPVLLMMTRIRTRVTGQMTTPVISRMYWNIIPASSGFP